jgi:hypothetical protein
MLYPQLEEKLHHARHALDRATSGNIIELCKQYLALLAEYRAELHKLPKSLGINQWLGACLLEDVDNIRRAIRAAIENTTRERNRTEALLRSFTAVSGYEAVEVLNRGKYKGHDNWKLSAGGVRFSDSTGSHRMTIQEAIEMASLLRREEHISKNAVASGASRTPHNVSSYFLSRTSESH